MRLFTMAVSLAAFFVIGFAPNPVSANCHADVEAARAKLSTLSEDFADLQKFKNFVNKAEKFQDDKKKKKKCGNILKKANNLLTKAGLGGKGGKKTSKKGGKNNKKKCASMMKEVEADIGNFDVEPVKLANIEINLSAAKEHQKNGKSGKCVKALKNALKKMGK